MKGGSSEYMPVIKKLLERTQQGRVRWHGAFGTFVSSIGSSSDDRVKFTLSTTATRDISYDERFLVMEDSKGNEVFRVASNDLPTSQEEKETSALINELYDSVRQRVLKVEVDDVLTLLDRT